MDNSLSINSQSICASLTDELMQYSTSTGAKLIFQHKGKLSIKKDVAKSYEFASSQLYEKTIDATSFMQDDACICLRVKAVMQDMHAVKTCPICNEPAMLNTSAKLSVPLYSPTCGKNPCKMSYMARCRKTTSTSRHNHSVSMSIHKARMLDAYNKCIDKFIANAFTCICLDDVKAFCQNAISSQHNNGALLKQRFWYDNVDIACSILAYTQFIKKITMHVSSVTELMMPERMYCIANSITSLRTCKFCGKPVQFINAKHGYIDSCALCKGEKYRTTCKCKTFKDLLDLISCNGYEILSYNEKAKGDINNSIDIKCKKCGHMTHMNIFNFKLAFNNANMHKLCKKCEKYVSKNEIELRSFVESIAGKNNIVCNSRKLIYPYELDIVVPNIKVAFEFNGSYWHNVNAVYPRYHLRKTVKCEDKGYALVHIWEDEWENCKDDVCKFISDIILHKDHMFSMYVKDILNIDRSKICKLLIPTNYNVVEIPPEVIQRDKYCIENCGYLACTAKN